MSEDFKVDTLIKTLKDLQREKGSLENKLKTLRDKRRKVESENEVVATRLCQVF